MKGLSNMSELHLSLISILWSSFHTNTRKNGSSLYTQDWQQSSLIVCLKLALTENAFLSRHSNLIIHPNVNF